MDLTTIVATLVVAFGLFTANAVVESDVVTVEFSVPSKYATAGFSAEVAQSFFLAELQDILDTKSMTPGRVIRGTDDKTVVSALAESLKLQDMTYSVQRALGYDVARIHANIVHDGEETTLVVLGQLRRGKEFKFSITRRSAEPLVTLIRRGARETAYQMEPYLALLYFVQESQSCESLPKTTQLIRVQIAALPAATLSAPRSQYENLLGIAALFCSDSKTARQAFNAAIEANPANAAAILNLAFVEIYEDRYVEAERVARRVLEPAPMAAPPAVISAAYLTWAAGLVGQRKFAEAEEKLTRSIAAYTYTSSAYEFWAQIKESQNDALAAEKMRGKAIENSLYFENYGELAMLYFEMAWRDGQKLERNKYGNPAYLNLMEVDK
jgi:tetratricopeptide (TPR) repeat protein